MKRTLMSTLVFALLLTLSSMTTSALAQNPERESITGASSQLVVTKVISPAKQRAALALMTREVIAAAQPMELPSQLGAAEVDTAALSQQEVTDPPAFVAAGTAAPGADRAAKAAYPSDWAALEGNLEQTAVAADLQADLPAGTSQVFTSYTVNQVAALQNLYPHRWVGRLSFTTPSGTSYCSGTSISGNVMLTAAHCIYDSTANTFYSNWVLAPAYRNGSAPFGTFAATQCWVLTAWVNLTGSYAINTWARHDVGVCKMGTNSAGTTLNNAVGWMGRQWNQPYIRHFHDIGYPFRNYNNALLPNAGLYLRACVAESFQQTTETRGMGCNFGGGISGGPWMVNYAPGVVGGNADGVNSGLFVGTQNLYGARFNSNNIVPLCSVAAC
jgi:V8-like Glu-specific endopeptidase